MLPIGHHGRVGARLGNRQRALLRALERYGGVWAAPQGAARCEAVAYRRAARRLAELGKCRAVYLRRRDPRGRWVRHLALLALDSDLAGDVLPLRAPAWIERPADVDFESFGGGLQAALLGQMIGRYVSIRTATRLLEPVRRERRDAPIADLSEVTSAGG